MYPNNEINTKSKCEQIILHTNISPINKACSSNAYLFPMLIEKIDLLIKILLIKVNSVRHLPKIKCIIMIINFFK